MAIANEAESQSRIVSAPVDTEPDGPRKPNAFVAFMRKKWTLPILSVVVFLTLWQIAGMGLNPILLSTPISVAASFWDLLITGQLWPAFLHSMAALGLGFGISAVVGIAIGLLMGRSTIAYRVLNPYVSFFQATPLVALLPLVVIWTGIGFAAEVTITCLLAVWSIIINTAEGARNTPPILLDMANIYHAKENQIVRHVAMPFAIPFIFAGLRIGLAKALIGVIIGEMDVSLKGLGGLIQNFGDSFQTAPLLAAIVTSSIVGVIGTAVLEVLRHYIAPWSTTVDRGKV